MVEDTIQRRLDIVGVVQGIGFRPTIFEIAIRHGLSGGVRNGAAGVQITFQGARGTVERATDEIRHLRLPGMRLDSMAIVDSDAEPSLTGFVINTSDSVNAGIEIPPDAYVCPTCRADMAGLEPYSAYPFTACTGCGPRLTVIRAVPYQRALTTLAPFPRCEACAKSYVNPADRRFNFETNTCWSCAPWIAVYQRGSLTVLGQPSSLEHTIERWQPGVTVRRLSPGGAGMTLLVAQLRACLEAGGIIMAKGTGGYQLIADPANETAIARLRDLKGRPAKPFAVMVPDVAAAAELCFATQNDRLVLESPQAPIVIMYTRVDKLAANVSAGRRSLGIMLPNNGIQLLLADRPLVVTSANRSEEPIIIDDAEALEAFGARVDMTFLHDRDIVVGVDDSVVLGNGDRVIPVRRARGYAPASIKLDIAGGGVMAVGADNKSALAVVKNGRAFLSPYVGDLANAGTRARFESHLRHLQDLLCVEVDTVVSDLHPGYVSTSIADDLEIAGGLRRLRVQHHHAHALSVMAEHHLSEAVAIVCDGTGYGSDGTVWGGEVLHVRTTSFTRLAHLVPYPLLGGENAVREPYRLVAVAEPYLATAFGHALGVPLENSVIGRAILAEDTPYARRRTLLRQLADSHVAPVATSSAGRLFDVAATILLGKSFSRYEADTAVELEEAAASCVEADLDSTVSRHRQTEFDGALGRARARRGHADDQIDGFAILAESAVIAEQLADPSLGALAFHILLAEAFADAALRWAAAMGTDQIVVSGGCCQNRLFLNMVSRAVEKAGLRAYSNLSAPGNDGGICLGQALFGLHAKERLCPE